MSPKKTPTTSKRTSMKKKTVVKKQASVTKLKKHIDKKKSVKKKITDKKSTKKSTKKGSVKKILRKIQKKPLHKTSKRYGGEEAFLASLEALSLRKNERYMNKRQRNHFEKILESWKKMLIIEQSKTAENLQQNPSNFPDQSDRASQEEEFTLELRTRERERKLLNKIEQSIEELVNLDYGYCRSCGIEIGIRRLEARPTATRCIDCKTLEEIKERQNFG